jgi:glycopeptide antibiotics resistance protein
MKLLKCFLFVLYTFTVTYIVFFARRRHIIVWYDGLVNLIPLQRTIEAYQSEATGRWNFFSNFFGNILLFAPLPFFLTNLFKIVKEKYILTIGLFVSVLIEVIQYVCRIGVPDIDDVLLNVLGVFTGLLLWNAVLSNSYINGLLSKSS